MGNCGIIRVERLRTMGAVKSSGLHTFREIKTENAITELKSANEHPNLQKAEEVFQAVTKRIGELDKKDKQAIRCLEFFVSASPEQFLDGGKLHSPESQKKYFDAALDFIVQKHGAKNVVCHVVHRDEKSPHLVVYVVPVAEREAKIRNRNVAMKASEGGGRRKYTEEVPARSELSAKAYYHCPAALSQLQTDYHAGVSKGFGLDRGVSRVDALKHKKPSTWHAEQNARIAAALVDLEKRETTLKTDLAVLEWEQRVLTSEQKVLAEGQKALSGGQEALREGRRMLEADTIKEKAFLLRVKSDLDQRAAALVGLDDREAAVVVGMADLKIREVAVNDTRDKFIAAMSLLPIEQKEAIRPDLEKIGVVKPRVSKR